MRHLYNNFAFVTLFVLCVSEARAQNITLPESICDGKEKASNLLDVVTDFMNKAKSMYPNCTDDKTNCGMKEKSFTFLEVASNLISKVKEIYPTCPEPECPKPVEKPMDCSEVLQNGNTESGVYTIYPRTRITGSKPLRVYCDMDTDGGGWTIIQRRGNFSTPKDYFFKDWASYKNGFGNVEEEFWIGNDNIYAISNQVNNTIRFDLTDAAGETAYAEYRTFWIDDEQRGYTLHIDHYNGTAGNPMDYNNNHKFSTKDRDNDGAKMKCAVLRKAAWWYNGCTRACLNGLYQPGVDDNRSILWTSWRITVGLKEAEIKLRPS